METTLSAGANVRLLDNSNFQSYRNGRQHRYIGGLAKQSPVKLTIPNSGTWHLVVDMQGLRGSVRASTRPAMSANLTCSSLMPHGGNWTNPERGKVKLGDYAAAWITERPGLRPRTVDLYRWLLGKHVAPYIGGVQVAKVSPAIVREWRAKLLANGVSVSMAAKALPASAGRDDHGGRRRPFAQEPLLS